MVINGEFRRIKRRRNRKTGLGKTTYDEMGNVTGDDGEPDPIPPPDKSIGVQYWEYMHQGDVQTESVIINGTNNPHAMDDNVFYNTEQGIRSTLDNAANAAQDFLSGSMKWIVIAAVAYFVLLPMVENHHRD